MTEARPTSDPVPCRRRDRNNGRDAGFIDTRPVIADVFEIPERTSLARHQCDGLGRIERRSATERDHNRHSRRRGMRIHRPRRFRLSGCP